jgi:rhamnose utilization protein RhaD (predicted bifunctional aldolase and dehydrogenase)
MASIDADPTYRALLALSSHIGADRRLVQGAGGNSSIKMADGVMWIKASGTWLADAQQRAIMVPVGYTRMAAALASGDPAAARQQDFIAVDLAAGNLRPSIETGMHAVIPSRIVVHVHCVATIARAIRADAEAAIAPLLEGIDWRFIPYAKPGVPLAEAINAVSPAPVYVLGNHGLVVTSETVDEAAALLADMSARLGAPRRQGFVPDLAGLAALTAGTNYVPAAEDALHAAADPALTPIAARSLYPDHVIFLGRGVPVIRTDETLPEKADLVLVEGAGAVLAQDASASARAMAGCLADVLSLLPNGVRVPPLSEADEDALLDWDAERYRQKIARI